ncbi:L-arabinokinase-like [Andrographis paniculata]|uniref:L-arabinokinase-like n=1 Tax=Andrographis paniculata TaxID=175694 RepID=UPI0021E916EC|nr:L-arabinokinase-like [Andrographis paniculata]
MEGQNAEKPLVFAYYVTGHGFGHATRVLEVVRNLILAGHEVHVVTGVPEYIFTTEIKSPKLFIRKVLLDCGVVQSDALTVDRLGSLETYVKTAVIPRASILASEVEWLKSINANLVACDAVPIACRVASDAGIYSACVTNFSWDFIYADFIMEAGDHSHSIIWQIAEDYSHCDLLIRLPGYCPMPAFGDAIDVPLVVRKLHKPRSEVRKELGIGEEQKVLIYNFGGQLAGWKLQKDYLPDGWVCLVCGATEGQELPNNFVKLPKDVYTPDIIAASDCMLGKVGYGAVSEALAYKVPLIFVRRDYFNEEPFMRKVLENYQCGVEIIRRDFLSGRWAPYIERAVTLKPCYDANVNGGEVVAKILQDVALGKGPTSKISGSRRLRDAIVLGYQLQSISGKVIDIPEWYVAQTQFISQTLEHENIIRDPSTAKEIEAFEILHGEHHGLSDTIGFLRYLTELHALSNGDNCNKNQLRDSLAAAAIFNWEEEIFVARAPGRLDVMGGIADYSGSLVLQMPIREACHVAVQRSSPDKHKLWKHAQARQHDKGQDSAAVLQIVSLGSELSNRAPTLDMDFSELMEDSHPISYEKAQQYFSQDPSQKWAAYVAGTILVLMTELGVRFSDSISILVFSDVPEGKGVSSSAAIEVATMSAVAAAHGLDISPRDLALLCQKVENHIVGAPCGVMDQMASACGEANKLLAMLCQPAEVLGHVEIPSHIRFWGIDSGIRHSVGGADYGSVRIGTFMGRKMIKSMASEELESKRNLRKVEGTNEHRSDLLQTEAALNYLCNLPPHRYEELYGHNLPESILGSDFLEKYSHHDDTVTAIAKTSNYAIQAPTRHPIYENFRVKAFKALLSAAPSDDQLSALGELMYQCHYSYSACGLGSGGTDKLVAMVQEMQHAKSSKSHGGTLFGAKITGGGSGGTVCVIGRNALRSGEQIFKIQEMYEATTGFLPYVFEGSSPGAGKFGFLKIRLRPRTT